MVDRVTQDKTPAARYVGNLGRDSLFCGPQIDINGFQYILSGDLSVCLSLKSWLGLSLVQRKRREGEGERKKHSLSRE